jgi:hypothetical protein
VWTSGDRSEAFYLKRADHTTRRQTIPNTASAFIREKKSVFFFLVMEIVPIYDMSKVKASGISRRPDAGQMPEGLVF